ncbi:MAG: phosphate/phosphite/phosphonate ABC transporter substrate-binding protein [Leptospirales bacterium]
MKNGKSILKLGISPLIIITMLYFFTASCKDNSTYKINTLRVGVIPDAELKYLMQIHEPLLKHISKSLGIEYKLMIPDSYEQLQEWFHQKKIDMAYFGGITFLNAHKNSGAIPIVARDIDYSFYSYYIVRKNSNIQSTIESKKQRICFGSRLSTSGHVMPRYFLEKEGISPEIFFSEVIYSGTHYNTIKFINENLCDIGVVSSTIFNKLADSKTISISNIRILSKTPPYIDNVWAIQPYISKDLKIKIRNAFLNIDYHNPLQREILENIGAKSFLPISIIQLKDLLEAKDLIESLPL